MKIFFTTPPLTLEQRYGSLAGAGSSAPSLGILMLAAVARKEGFDCAVVEASAQALSCDELLERLVAASPQVLCISSTTLAIGNASAFAVRAREALPSVRIVVGGPHVTAAPRETMEHFTAFEVAVLGEGEATLAELLHALEEKRGLATVQGILYREAGDLLSTERRPFLKDLDALPAPAWDLLEGFPERYLPAPFKVMKLPAATLVTSRGCPNTCIFCDRSVFGSSCHAFSADYVVRQMVELNSRYGIREFSFEDDTFITFGARLKEICQRLIALKLDISWTCLGRVNNVTEENLRLMRQAGCWQISFGIESGSAEILALINKRVTKDQIRQALLLSRRAGIRTKGFFIIGHPGETPQTLKATIDFALELPLNDISACLMTPFPGTELYRRASEFGDFNPEWSTMNLLNTVFVPYGLSAQELERAQKELLRRFYLRPGIVADYAKRLLENPLMAKGMWSGFIALIKSVRSRDKSP